MPPIKKDNSENVNDKCLIELEKKIDTLVDIIKKLNGDYEKLSTDNEILIDKVNDLKDIISENTCKIETFYINEDNKNFENIQSNISDLHKTMTSLEENISDISHKINNNNTFNNNPGSSNDRPNNNPGSSNDRPNNNQGSSNVPYKKDNRHKTRQCIYFSKGQCNKNENCTFLHE